RNLRGARHLFPQDSTGGGLGWRIRVPDKIGNGKWLADYPLRRAVPLHFPLSIHDKGGKTMKLKVLGCSGGIGGNLRTTSFLLDQDVLIDAGTGANELSLTELSMI